MMSQTCSRFCSVVPDTIERSCRKRRRECGCTSPSAFNIVLLFIRYKHAFSSYLQRTCLSCSRIHPSSTMFHVFFSCNSLRSSLPCFSATRVFLAVVSILCPFSDLRQFSSKRPRLSLFLLADSTQSLAAQTFGALARSLFLWFSQ